MATSSTPSATLYTPPVLVTNSPLRALPPHLKKIALRGGIFELGERYINGEWDGDLEEVITHVALNGYCKKRSLRRLATLLITLLINKQRGARAYEIAERHYDLGNLLFSSMLDSTMSYTCGHWNGCATLEDAQRNKLRLICDKLKLSPGMRVLDIGCGWGNFAHYAATHFGVEVVGLTVSKEQAAYARERCKGLPVEIRLQDYATLHEEFDRVVSIEMIEAVGKRNLPHYYKVVNRCLKQGGLFVLQVITGETYSSRSQPALDDYLVWLVRHIFPNGYLPSPAELQAPEKVGLKIEHVHNLGEDYIKTLVAWEENFERSWSTLQAHYSERFRRIWRFYLGGCRVMFRQKFVQVHQVVYQKQ